MKADLAPTQRRMDLSPLAEQDTLIEDPNDKLLLTWDEKIT